MTLPNLDPRAAPWRVPDTTPPATRVDWLNRGAELASRDELVSAWARTVAGDGTLHDRVARLLAAVQLRPYVPDPQGEEWYQGAAYTLGHGGDCEDLSQLLAAASLAIGVPGRVVWVPQPGSPLNHVTEVEQLGGQWVPAEPSVPGARLGEDPWHAARRTGFFERLGRARVNPSGAVDVGDTRGGDWEKITGPDGAWTQWARLDVADGWFTEAAARFSEAKQAELEGQPWEVQHRATVDAYQALAWGYAACDLPPVIDPAWRAMMLAAFGRMSADSFTDAKQQKVAVVQSVGAARLPSGPRQADVRTQLAAEWALMGRDRAEFARRLGPVWIRVSLTSDATVLTNRDANPFAVEENYTPAAGAYVGCKVVGANTDGCGDAEHPYNWDVLNWHDPPANPFAAYQDAWTALPPFRWFFELGRQVANACAERGAVAVIDNARTLQTALNVRQAIDRGMLQGGTPDMDKLITAAADLPADLTAAAYNNPGIQKAASVVRAVGAVARNFNPAVGAAVEGLGALVSILPAATACDEDDFGRCQPVYERPWISGTATQAPRQQVPDPPVLPQHQVDSSSSSTPTMRTLGPLGVGALLGYLTRNPKAVAEAAQAAAAKGTAPAPKTSAGIILGTTAGLGALAGLGLWLARRG